MWKDGRAGQKDVVAAEGAFMANELALGTGASSTASIRFPGSLARFLSRSFLGWQRFFTRGRWGD
jgi:hypothetical protein